MVRMSGFLIVCFLLPDVKFMPERRGQIECGTVLGHLLPMFSDEISDFLRKTQQNNTLHTNQKAVFVGRAKHKRITSASHPSMAPGLSRLFPGVQKTTGGCPTWQQLQELPRKRNVEDFCLFLLACFASFFLSMEMIKITTIKSFL